MGGRTREDVIRPTLRPFKRALDFRNYRLIHRSQKFDMDDGKRIVTWTKRMKAEMRTRILDGSDPVRIIIFLDAFKRSCNNVGAYEGTATFLIPQFRTRSVQQDLWERIETRGDPKQCTEFIASYCQAVNYLLKRYADNDVI